MTEVERMARDSSAICEKCDGDLYFDFDQWEPYCPKCETERIEKSAKAEAARQE